MLSQWCSRCLPRSTSPRLWHLAPTSVRRSQVAEASQGRGPQPLSMRSGVAPRPATTVATASVGVDADELRRAFDRPADVSNRPADTVDLDLRLEGDAGVELEAESSRLPRQEDDVV